MVDPSIVETYTVGKEGFIVALCEVLGVRSTRDNKSVTRRNKWTTNRYSIWG